ncbi:MAG: ribonuclease HII [Candidatus Atribacteria bacterium]|nr:ribonuclease HII [Candidatus Atribacteria bacterium]
MPLKKSISHYQKKISFLCKERLRVEKLKILERKLLFSGFTLIAGLDEAGRGALAGPVVAAAVVIKDINTFFIADLKDSKKIAERKREYLYELIMERACNVGIGSVDSETIDKVNILEATLLAMKRAINSLKQCPDYLLIDAIKIPYISIPQDSLIRGENRSISIAAASVVAKVYRDRLMREYHKMYPSYQFDQHKGYGTKKHLQAIRAGGTCPIHRKTFSGVLSDNLKNGTKKDFV